MDTNDDRQTKLWDLIKDIQFALFTTRHANGHLHSRPMTTQNKNIEQDDKLWFFAAKQGEAAQDIGFDDEVNVGFADPKSDRYVSVSGRAHLVQDRVKAQALWTKAAAAWFPGGVDDPNFALIEVRITHAHYWDIHSSKLVQLYAIAKAAVTGKPPKDLGDSAEVRMR